MNAFDFAPNGKLYAPAVNTGSILEIDLIEDSNGTRAEYYELFTGLIQPTSVRVNDDSLLVAIDRATGFVWKYDLQNDTSATCIASLEPGLDNFDFFKANKILVTANRNRLWEVSVNNGHVKTRLESPVALPQAMDVGKTVDDFDVLYVADNYAVLLVNLYTGSILNVITGFNNAGLAPLNSIDGIHVSETKLYVSDSRTGFVSVLDRETLAPLDLFGGFFPGNIPLTQPTYVLEDNQGDLLVALPANGEVIKVTRVAGQQINQVIVDNVPVPLGLARDGDTLYISDLGTNDTNGAVYAYDLSGSSTSATLLKNNLSRPQGLTVSGNDVLVVETAASQITAIDPSQNTTIVADSLDIEYLTLQTSFFAPVPVASISDIVVAQNGTIFFGANAYEGSIQYLTD